jgi:hypothetical protein
MSPANRTNPDTTDAEGRFGWDVIAGFYKVRAEKEGCVSPENPLQAFVETQVLEIPPPATDLELILNCESPAALSLHQDPADGATGLKLAVTRAFEPGTDGVLLLGFQSQLLYPDASANPAFPVGTLCVNILDVRQMDLPITDRKIDNTAGVATFGGSDANGVPWPADLGHGLTQLTGSASQQCQVSSVLISLSDMEANSISTPQCCPK